MKLKINGRLFTILLPIAVILCFVLCYLGAHYHMQILIYLGIAVIFGTVFLILIIGLTVKFVRSYKHSDDLVDWSDPKTLTTNDTYVVAEYIFGRGLFGFRMAPKKAKILSYLLMLFVILNCFCGIFLLFLHFEIAGTICLCCFGVTVFICMLSAILRFIFSIGVTMKKEQDEEAEIDREHQEILKKFENEEFEYDVATVVSCTLLPSSENRLEDKDRKWYEYVLEFGGREHTVRHPDDRYEVGSRVVVYFIADLIFINDPKTRKLQQEE